MSVPNVNCKIQYIENEETLSRSPALMRKYGDKRNFYSCKQSQDYMTYVATGATQKLDYIEYSGDKEKSTGIFGKDGLLNARQRKELREQLRETKSIIWDCLLTFQPEFGQTYCNDYEQAYAMMKREMPRFLKDAGFNPENVVWYAGLHTNKRHRHIHISFFEKEPSRYRQRGKDLCFSQGKINQTCLNRFKLHVEQRLTDASAELRVARKEITAITKDVLFSRDSTIKYNNRFAELVCELAEKLPHEGRISYDSENMRPLKPLIDRITDTAIKSNPKWYKAFVRFCGEVQKHDEQTREMLIRNKIPEKHWDKYLKSDVFLSDLYRRMGNQILNYVRIFKKKERPARGRLARKRIRNKTALEVIMRSAQLQAAMQADSEYFFEEYLRKLEEARENIQGEMEMDEMD